MNIIRSLKEQLSYLYRTKYPARVMVKDAMHAGFTDVNDYIEDGQDQLAKNAMQKLFSYNFMHLGRGRVLEIGAGTGRFTRELQKHLTGQVKIISIERSSDYCHFLRTYVVKNHWSNVSVVEGDCFHTKFTGQSFNLILVPWFIQPLSLFKYGELFAEARRLLKKGGLLIFDFMDSQEKLLQVIDEPSNNPYFLINGKDLERVGKHLGFTKKLEFSEKFKKQIAKYHVYEKR